MEGVMGRVLYFIKYDHKTLIYEENKKAEFLRRYLSLKDAWYCVNLETYKATNVEEINLNQVLDF
jgi:hypothetical protein